MFKLNQTLVTAIVAGLAGALGASLSGNQAGRAQSGDFWKFREAAHSQVVFLNKSPESLPTPSIPKDWRLVSVGFEGHLWFQDTEGHVYAVNMNMHDDKMAISPNVYRLPAK